MITITPQDFLSQAVLTFCTFLLVAGVRKLWGKFLGGEIDGKWLVLVCAMISGLVLSSLATVLFKDAHALALWTTWQTTILVGLGAGIGSFAGANAWTWSASKLPTGTNVVMARAGDLTDEDDELNPWAKTEIEVESPEPFFVASKSELSVEPMEVVFTDNEGKRKMVSVGTNGVVRPERVYTSCPVTKIDEPASKT